MIKRTPVTSSNVISVGWADDVLEVEFKGGVYHYAGVPKATYDELMKAESVGRYINAFIKPRYEATKVLADKPTLAFGTGALVIDTGRYAGAPAVFVWPAKAQGEVGARAADVEYPPTSGEVVLTFPTDEQARRVADALCNFPQVAA